MNDLVASGKVLLQPGNKPDQIRDEAAAGSGSGKITVQQINMTWSHDGVSQRHHGKTTVCFSFTGITGT